MTIYLDFDGTVVEHFYPIIGDQNPHCFEVLTKLFHAGHKIILNTKRVEFMDGSLEQAMAYIAQQISVSGNIRFQEFLSEHTPMKIVPPEWDWNLHMETETIYIDDICPGIPMRNNINNLGQMVDWKAIDAQFVKQGLY